MPGSVVPSPEVILEHVQDLTFEHFGFGNSIDQRIININMISLDGVINNGVAETREAQVASPSGLLAHLPLEILQAVVLQLDIWSLTRFRAVNRHTRSVIDRNLQYANVKEQMPHVLFALLKTRAASWIPLNLLHRNLHAGTCFSCGDLAPFLYLLTCERVCSICFSSKLQYLPLIESEVKRLFQIPTKILRLLPKLRSLPGTYSDESKVWRRRVTLFDRRAVEMATRSSNLIESNTEAEANASAQVDRLGGNPYRFMAILHVPWFDREHNIFERGLSCRSCGDSSFMRDLDADYDENRYEDVEEHLEEDSENADANEVEVDDGNVNNCQREMTRRLDGRTLYTIDGYVEHVRHCKGSRELLSVLRK